MIGQMRCILTVAVVLLVSIETYALDQYVANSVATVDAVTVEAVAKTEVELRRIGQSADASPQPFEIDIAWEFDWSQSEAGEVPFSAVLDFGDYDSITDAGTLGGVSTQSLRGVQHQINGVANYDPRTQVMQFSIKPEERDDGRASRVSISAPATCEPDGSQSCKAFLKQSLEFEGLKLKLKFNDELTGFEGELQLTQYGGAGFTRSQSDFDISVNGRLAASAPGS